MAILDPIVLADHGADRLPLDADAPCTAEVAECCCPEFCERDHANE